MAITFHNIPEVRTPGVYTEIDNSRALKGLTPNPHRALIIGQKAAVGSIDYDTLVEILGSDTADGFFGPGSIAARMCNKFKEINPKTQLYGIAIGSGATLVQASGGVNFSDAVANSTYNGKTTKHNIMINGVNLEMVIPNGATALTIAAILTNMINSDDYQKLPVTATAASGVVYLSALCFGELGNYIDVRQNYYPGNSTDATLFSTDPLIGIMGTGSGAPSLDDAWAVLGEQQFNYIIQPYTDDTNLTSIEDELDERFGPMIDLGGIGFTFVRGTLGSCTTLGNSRNSPYNVIGGLYDMPNAPEEWAATLGGIAADKLHDDPARPLQFLQMGDLLPPPIISRFNREERDVLLHDGIATFTYDSDSVPLIERSITTYQKNAAGIPDASFLDVQTIATLLEIRFQDKARMIQRFIEPRFKLADDNFPVQPNSFVATPKTIKQETIALFTLLRDKGLIENLKDFIDNLVVERDEEDKNRVNRLLPVDLINQFRVLATKLEFIL